MKRHYQSGFSFKYIIILTLAVVIGFPTIVSAGIFEKSTKFIVNDAITRMKGEKAKKDKYYEKEYKKQSKNPNYSIKDYDTFRNNKILDEMNKKREIRNEVGFWRWIGSRMFGESVLYIPRRDKVEYPEAYRNMLDDIQELPSGDAYDYVVNLPDKDKWELIVHMPSDEYNRITNWGKKPFMPEVLNKMASTEFMMPICYLSEDQVNYHYSKIGNEDLSIEEKRNILKETYGDYVADDIFFDEIENASDDMIGAIYSEFSIECPDVLGKIEKKYGLSGYNFEEMRYALLGYTYDDWQKLNPSLFGKALDETTEALKSISEKGYEAGIPIQPVQVVP